MQQIESQRKTLFDMFKNDFTIFKKIIFLIVFSMTLTAIGYWAYLLYKIYTDDRPLFDKDGKHLSIPHPDGAVWSDFYHYDTHLLAAFQASVLGSLLCIVIVIAL